MPKFVDVPKKWFQDIDNAKSLIVMHAFCQFLKEKDDPRWEPLQFMASHGKLCYSGVWGIYARAIALDNEKFMRLHVFDPEWAQSLPSSQRGLGHLWLSLAGTYVLAQEEERTRWLLNTRALTEGPQEVSPEVLAVAEESWKEICQDLTYTDDDGDVVKLTCEIVDGWLRDFLAGGNTVFFIDANDAPGLGTLSRLWSLYMLRKQPKNLKNIGEQFWATDNDEYSCGC